MSTFVDFDYDGEQDLITASCNLLEERDLGFPVGIPGPIILFKNTIRDSGTLGFEDVTEDLFGKLQDGFWMGVSMADLNADGRIDFFSGNAVSSRNLTPWSNTY